MNRPTGSNKKRIAFVFNHHFFLGGGEFSFFDLIRSLDKSTFEPLVIVPCDGEILERLAEITIPAFALPLPPLKTILSGKPFFALFKLVNFLRGRGVDIIHANGSRVCLYSVLAGRALGIPVFWHVRETLRDFFLYDVLLLALSKVVISVSESVKRKRFDRFHVSMRQKIKIVHNGIDIDAFKPEQKTRNQARRDLDVGENEVLFGLVANYIPLKGQDFFLRTLGKVIEGNLTLPIKALLVGRPLDLPYFRMLEHLVSEMGLEKKVIFMGFTRSINDIYTALDVFVLTSKREGFSRSILEAMSANLPIVATHLQEIEEAVIDNQNGLLVDYGDIENLAFAIRRLTENAPLRSQMGKANRQKAIEKFSLEFHARSIERLYLDAA
jgi:glycosyltransferase involved in cell wall biosynthesis